MVDIPTNRPMVRADHNDQIYKTKDGKWEAVRGRDRGRHEKGQPVLVGTISVEVSETLSDTLKKRGIKHVVLNAKPEHAEREGETIAEAGRAGRGHDRDQHGRPRRRHQARRQRRAPDAASSCASSASSRATSPGTRPTTSCSRGSRRRSRRSASRSWSWAACSSSAPSATSRAASTTSSAAAPGRQGDPGESRFYLSAEDDLVRLFAGDRIYRILDRLGPTDEEGREQPIEAKMLSRTIENAQKKVEQQNFLIRKRVLEYDDVLNQQREVVYKYRREILEGRDMSGTPRKEELRGVFERIVADYTPGDFVEDWDVDGLFTQVEQIFDPSFGAEDIETRRSTATSWSSACTRTRSTPTSEREEELGEELMRAARALRAAADHRRALARAPATTWTTCARASTCAASPRRTRWSSTRTRASRCSGPDELDLGGLRAATSSTSRSRSSRPRRR